MRFFRDLCQHTLKLYFVPDAEIKVLLDIGGAKISAAGRFLSNEAVTLFDGLQDAAGVVFCGAGGLVVCNQVFHLLVWFVVPLTILVYTQTNPVQIVFVYIFNFFFGPEMLLFAMTKKRKPGRPATGVTKQRILVTVDIDLAKRARAAGINISAACEAGIRRELGQ